MKYLFLIIGFLFAASPVYATTVFLNGTSSINQSWSVPADWNNANNSVTCIGAGGNGALEGGGGGGSYASTTNLTLSGSITYTIGIPATTSVGNMVNETYFNSTASSTASLSCASGKAAVTNTAGPGGTTANSIGTLKYAGGNGGAGSTGAGSGGGGSAGMVGAGKNGAADGTATGAAGGGGSNGNSSTNGTAGSGSNGGIGGEGTDGTGHGTGGSVGVAGGDGTAGKGAGGGGAGQGAKGGNGSMDTTFDATHGAGGGGGGGGAVSVGGNGAFYGGGGGGAGSAGTAGTAGQGLIVIIYSPLTPTVASYSTTQWTMQWLWW